MADERGHAVGLVSKPQHNTQDVLSKVTNGRVLSLNKVTLAEAVSYTHLTLPTKRIV